MTSPYTLLKGSDLLARKELGQNFLKDPKLASRIVAEARIDPDDMVLEIGAGLGQLTLAIARATGQVVAVEKDCRMIPLLRAALLAAGFGDVAVVAQDILRIPLDSLVSPGAPPMIVLGNLPYNIASQVVVKLVNERHLIRRAVLMLQKELAERLCAPPGGKTYGRLSVLLQYCATVKPLLSVKADQFFPKPQVDSTVVEIDFKTEITPSVGDEKLFVQVIQAAFGRRRKTLRNALAGTLLAMDTGQAAEVLLDVNIDPQRRAETLSVAEYVALTDRIERGRRG